MLSARDCSVLLCLLSFLFLGTLSDGLSTMGRGHSAKRHLCRHHTTSEVSSTVRTVHQNGQGLARPSASSVSHVCSDDLLQRGKRKNQGNSSKSRPWPLNCHTSFFEGRALHLVTPLPTIDESIVRISHDCSESIVRRGTEIQTEQSKNHARV